MIIYPRPRGSGKTTLAIQWLLVDPDNRVLVAANQDQVSEIRSRVEADYGVKLPNKSIVCWDNVVNGYAIRGRSIKEIWYDQIDDMIRQYAPRADVTATIDSNPYVCPASLMIKGEHFPCDWMDQMAHGSPNHDGWAHSNRAAEAIWTSVAVVESPLLANPTHADIRVWRNEANGGAGGWVWEQPKF